MILLSKTLTFKAKTTTKDDTLFSGFFYSGRLVSTPKGLRVLLDRDQTGRRSVTFDPRVFELGPHQVVDTAAEAKVTKLKRLLLLTDPAVSDAAMNELSVSQWSAFVDEFPDEAPEL